MTRRILRILAALAALGVVPAYAADTNPPPKAAPVKATTYTSTSPFFVGVDAGMGWMNTQAQFLTIPGEFAGSGHIFPTGGLAGLTAGVGSTFGGLYAEAFVRADYAFTRASGSSPTDNFAVKNSWDLQQGVAILVPLSTMMGTLPSPHVTIPAPSAWPIPVNVPTNFSGAALLVGLEGGAVERSIGVNVSSLSDGTGSSVNRWMYGEFVGLRAKYLVSQNVDLNLSYDHEFYNNAWTQSGGSGLIGAFKEVGTNTLRGGFNYHF